MTILFWACFGFVLYTYAGYPLLMILWARLRAPRHRESRAHHPTVTVVIAACNEQERIGRRVENIFSQNYPQQRLNVVVVSDGSTDGTVAALERMRHPRLQVIELTPNRGKAVALNRGVAAADGEIVLFTDSRQRFAPDAIQRLVQPFTDSRVGGTTGELVLCESGEEGEPKGVGIYWRYEKAIRAAESAVDSVVGATGAIYAIRRELYRELPRGLILDDVLTPLNITAQGYRLKMVREAQAYDRISSSAGEEFQRKVRTLAGNVQLLSMAPWVMNPLRNRIFFQWFSHKMCRMIAPYALLGMLLLPWFLGGAGFLAFGLLQLLVYAMAGMGTYAILGGRSAGPNAVPASFLMLNLAAIAGLLAAISGRAEKLWKKQ